MRPDFARMSCRRGGPAVALAIVLAIGWGRAASAGNASPQRLPSAVLIYPLVVVEGGGTITDTRIELVNLSRRAVSVGCIFVTAGSCSEFDFHLQLTPNQPLSWFASGGLFNSSAAIPPFSSTGELKCIVEPTDPSIDAHNTIQGRAEVFGADGQTIGYSAFGFLRLTDGPLTNEIDLDGATYTQCPDEQHFVFLATGTGGPPTESELVLAPCSEDLENLVVGNTVVQFQVFNEFEEQFSASTSVTCSLRRSLRQISNVFTRATLGSDTGHVIVKGVQTPVIAMVIDRFVTPSVPATAGNEPALRGGRSAQIRIP
jgi:hypothetical protein